jgi:hypothetical protein
MEKSPLLKDQQTVYEHEANFSSAGRSKMQSIDKAQREARLEETLQKIADIAKRTGATEEEARAL